MNKIDVDKIINERDFYKQVVIDFMYWVAENSPIYFNSKKELREFYSGFGIYNSNNDMKAVIKDITDSYFNID